jgi:hypothetical protein
MMGLGPPNPCNLIRDCLRLHLFDPRCVSYSDVMIHTKIAHHKLLESAKDAPALRCQHLLDLQKAKDKRGESTRSAIILKILTQEQERKKWPQYDTKQEVMNHTSNHLSECFRLAYSALCYQ